MQGRTRVGRPTWRIAVLAGCLLGWSANGPAGQLRVRDLDNRLVDPLAAAPETKAIVLLFTSVDCPISNRYAPTLKRLYDTYGSRGVTFWLVYPNPAEEPEAIRAHMNAFAYPARALRDPRQELVKLAHATVAPEAAVFTPAGRLVYRGRIDDRYVNLGLERPAPTTHDLEDAVTATLSGKPVAHPITQAVGCFLSDFLR
jgi:hypothetical protein